MNAITRSFPGLVFTIGLVFDRLWFPLAVIVGLAGGAMIGTEIMQLQAPALPTFH